MSSPPKRVVITGLGVISPLGSSPEALWDGLRAGCSGVGPLSCLPADATPVKYAAEARQFTGEIDNFGPLDKEQKKAIRKGSKMMCRECQMGVAAAQLALADAGLTLGKTDVDRTGISFGSDYMLSAPEEFTEGVRQCLDAEGRFQFARWGGEGLPKMSPLWLLKYLPNMPASHLAIYNDLRGPNNSITLREASANVALGEAMQIILRGSAEAMLVGCTGTRLHPMKTIHAVQHEELADPDAEPVRASRPFDRGRTGMVLGEGAAAIVLEEFSAAQARGATVSGEVLAAASTAVAGRRLLADRRQAMINVLTAVLTTSGLKPEVVGHLHAHGLSTRSCDVEEAQAIQAVFGDRAEPIPVVAAKGNFGNLGAGSGMVELIASLLALKHRQLFPVLNYETPDPECPVSAATNGAAAPGDCFINLSVTPQGQASAALVRRWD
ncbi:MAG: beta-ketoacyl-[acyl-carrier-protein] synthase family protein [Pirellulales bacterium]|nr:beta-ketoacyl-[acyl-carrier-protein] synthase family protein [Pirellulales bacterium]